MYLRLRKDPHLSPSSIYPLPSKQHLGWRAWDKVPRASRKDFSRKVWVREARAGKMSVLLQKLFPAGRVHHQPLCHSRRPREPSLNQRPRVCACLPPSRPDSSANLISPHSPEKPQPTPCPPLGLLGDPGSIVTTSRGAWAGDSFCSHPPPALVP